MGLIDADALKEAITHKAAYFDVGPKLIPAVLLSNIYDTIDEAPTVEQECYITGAQWDEFMKEHKRPDAIKFNKIKAIIDNWAVDDDEHELLEQISDIVDETEVANLESDEKKEQSAWLMIGNDLWMCPKCKVEVEGTIQYYNYCFCCGADMRGDRG